MLYRIPTDIPWVRDKGYPLPYDSKTECPKDLLVGVDEVVKEAVQVIKNNLPLSLRVPPLALTRMYRGGKTTVSYHINIYYYCIIIRFLDLFMNISKQMSQIFYQ